MLSPQRGIAPTERSSHSQGSDLGARSERGRVALTRPFTSPMGHQLLPISVPSIQSINQ